MAHPTAEAVDVVETPLSRLHLSHDNPSKFGGDLKSLLFHRYFADLTMEVGAVHGNDNLEAIRDEIDGGRVAVILREASLASLAAGRTPQVFVPLVSHHEAPNPALRLLFQSN